MALSSIAISATADVFTRRVNYHGLTVRETGATTATIVLRRGGSSGVIVETVALAAGESVGIERHFPVSCDGLHVTVTGTIEGAVLHS